VTSFRFSEDIRSLSEFRANTATFIAQVQTTRRPLVLTQHGRGAAVLLAVDEYERLVEAAVEKDRLRRGEEEASGGSQQTHGERMNSVPAARADEVNGYQLEGTVSGLTGRRLNNEWQVGARHALYHHEGTWYHQLQRFPGALFDSNGYVLFRSQEEFLNCPMLNIRKDVHIPNSLAAIPGYIKRRT
jgi:prevent-host-death family protein